MILIIFQFFFITETTVDAVLNQTRTCRKVQYRRFRVRGYNAFKFTRVQSRTRTDKKRGQKTHLFNPLIFLNTLSRPLAPPQECPRKCGVHRSYHDGMGNRCFRFRHWGSVRSHAGRHSMQPERAKSGENYLHVVIRLRERVVRARPEHDAADTREVPRRFRVRVREYLPGRVYTCSFFFVYSHSSLFILLFRVTSFCIFNFDICFSHYFCVDCFSHYFFLSILNLFLAVVVYFIV